MCLSHSDGLTLPSCVASTLVKRIIQFLAELFIESRLPGPTICGNHEVTLFDNNT